MERGLAALSAQQYNDALTAFRAVSTETPLMPHGYHGMGVALFGLNQRPKAREMMEMALTRARGTPTRGLVWNFAIIHYKDEPMRAARVLRDYLGRPNAKDDEELLSLLGGTLFRTVLPDRMTQFYTETRAFYLEKEKALALSKGDGRRRWGTEWVSSSDADRLWKTLIDNGAEAIKARNASASAMNLRQKAWDRLVDIRTSMALIGTAERRAASLAYDQADANARQARLYLDKVEEKLRETQLPSFPEKPELMAVDVPY
jgi:hypothetical protein